MRLVRTLWARRRQHADRVARFVLFYTPPNDASLTVGTLDFDGQVWTFEYHDEYRARRDLRPLEGFDDLDRVYRSTALFPFFAVRIPDVDRQDIRRQLREADLADPEASDLLRFFGRHAASSPAFELVPA